VPAAKPAAKAAGGGAGGKVVAAKVVRRGTVTGRIVNAVSGAPMDGVPTQILRGTTVVARPMTNGDGQFSANIPAGTYSVRVSHQGFFDFSQDVTVAPSTTVRPTLPLAPAMANSQSRITLSWGSTPRDLDAYLKVPTGCLVNWRNMNCHENSVRLDRDDVNGHGPETLSITQWHRAGNTPYVFYVHNWSQQGNQAQASSGLRSSSGVVHVYLAGAQYTFNSVSDGVIQGDKWYVFKIGTDDTAAACDQSCVSAAA
jgi:uncharacterized protein YfaP (DUF2135 family)